MPNVTSSPMADMVAPQPALAFGDPPHSPSVPARPQRLRVQSTTRSRCRTQSCRSRTCSSSHRCHHCRSCNIHRIIHAQSPTTDGIELTVFGINFHPGMQLECMFREAVANTVQRQTDNTFVTVLLPRPVGGFVGGIPKEDDGMPPYLFMCRDETNRSLYVPFPFSSLAIPDFLSH
jgi:hypothetical protein